MCLIIHKSKDAALPIELLNSAFKQNKDGWGVVWYDENSIAHVIRSLEYSNMARLPKMLEGREAAIHLRFKTHGEINLENCHPFDLGNNSYLMHNGVISAPDVHTGKSDTWHFNEYVAKPLMANGLTDAAKVALKHLTGTGNRLLIITPNEMHRIGNAWHELKPGLWLSNQSAYNTNYMNEGFKKWLDAKKTTTHTPTPYKSRFDGLDNYDNWQDRVYGDSFGNYPASNQHYVGGLNQYYPPKDLYLSPDEVESVGDVFDYFADNAGLYKDEWLAKWLASRTNSQLTKIFMDMKSFLFHGTTEEQEEMELCCTSLPKDLTKKAA